MKVKKNNKGQLLIEAIIGLGILTILIAAITPLFLVGTSGLLGPLKKTVAENLVQETVVALEAMKNENWNIIYKPLGGANKGASFAYHSALEAGRWILVDGEETVNLNGSDFTRRIIIENVSRTGVNGAGDIEATYNPSREDPSTQKLIIIVGSDGSLLLSVEKYLTRNRNEISEQTDWSTGNFSSQSQIDSSVPGQLSLAKTASAPYGNRYLVDSTAALYRLNSANKRVSMRFTAQKSGLVNQVRVYIQNNSNSNQISYRFGLRANAGGNPAPTWLSYGTANVSAAGWLSVNLQADTEVVAGQVYHLVVEYGSGAQPNNRRYIEIRGSFPLNQLYPLSMNDDLDAGNLIYDGSWQVVANSQPIYLLGFTDITYEGSPYDNRESRGIYQTNVEAEKFTFSAEEKTTGVGLYVAKSKNTNPAGPLKVKLTDLTDNENVLADEDFIFGADLSTTFSWKTHSFNAPIILPAEHLLRLEFYSPLAKPSSYYSVTDISTPDSPEYIGLTWDGVNSIASRSTGGNPFSDLAFVDLCYELFLEGAGYAGLGELTSSTYDLGNALGNGFNRLSWQATVPTGTSVKLKLAANNDNATWLFLGPAGSEMATDNYTLSSGENIWTGLANLSANRYLRYKVILEGNGNNTPTLDWVRINWAP